MKKSIKLTVLIVLAISMSSCWQFRQDIKYKDYENDGRSELIKAEAEKKVMIEDAKAKNESATLQAEAKIKIAKAEAQAEIERAKGVAEANKIIGESLKDSEIYLRYLQIDAIRNSKGEKIYVPTEAGLPILEAK